MIRRSPCELYLKYLIVRHEAYTDDQIVDICRLHQLDYIGRYFIRGLRAEAVPPIPFYPENNLHKPSFRFKLKHGLSLLFQPDLHMQTATRLLDHPRAKELLEQMLLSRAPYGWIVAALKQAGYSVTGEAVQCFKTHYFDVDAVDATEMRALMRLRVQEGAGTTDPEMAKVAAAYEKASWMDPRISATNAPITPLATMVSALRIGFMPDPAGLPRLLSSGRMLGAVRMNEAMMTNGKDDAQRAAYYAQAVKISHEVLESTGNPEEDFHSKLANLTVQTDQPEVPMLHELSGGNHTGQMEPGEGERHAGAERTRKKGGAR